MSNNAPAIPSPLTPSYLDDKLYLPTKNLIQGQNVTFFWVCEQRPHWSHSCVWSDSSNYYAHPSLVHFYTSDLYEHDTVWGNHTGDFYDPNYFNWQYALKGRPLTLKLFFIQQQIDTPLFLKQSRSQWRDLYQTPSQTLIGMLSRHGSHPKIWRYYLRTYDDLIREFLYPNRFGNVLLNNQSLLNWSFFYPNQSFRSLKESFMSTTIYETSKKIEETSRLRTRFGNFIKDDYIKYDLHLFFNSVLYQRLQKYLPIFAMKFKKVDKLRYKHSRGKSGKYTVEWKYIPSYKRMSVVLRWLTDDITLQKSFVFRDQIKKSLKLLLTDPSESVVVKNRNYVHKYIYSRYKNSLLRTLKKI